jgi:hypothetical protein
MFTSCYLFFFICSPLELMFLLPCTIVVLVPIAVQYSIEWSIDGMDLIAEDQDGDEGTPGGPPSGPGVGAGCASESGAARAGKVKDRRESSGAGAGGGSLADIIRRGREHRREAGVDVEVVVLAPAAGHPPPGQTGQRLQPACPWSQADSYALSQAESQGSCYPCAQGRDDERRILPPAASSSEGAGTGRRLREDMLRRGAPPDREARRGEAPTDGCSSTLAGSLNALSVVLEQGQSMARTRSCTTALRAGQACAAAAMERDSLEMESSRGGAKGAGELRHATADHASKMELIRQQCEDVLGLE